MRLMQYGDQLVAWTPAKVNLFLEIVRKRPDGYHDLVTLMTSVSLFDTLVFRPAFRDELLLSCNDPTLSVREDNLILKAARLLAWEARPTKGVRIQLTKRIPMQAGLGGGSSDAAATLVALNRFWNAGLSRERLVDLGATLGSDVAFFIKGDAAWCTGRGEYVDPMTLGRRLDLILVKPPFGCSTPEVYRGMTVPVSPISGESLKQGVEKGDIDAIIQGLHNRLSESALRLAPPLVDYLEKLRRLGSEGVQLSGSGSTVFALCRGRGEAKELARRYASEPVDKDDKVFVVRSCASPLPP